MAQPEQNGISNMTQGRGDEAKERAADASAASAAGLSDARDRFYTHCAVVLLVAVTILAAARWRQYPVFVDAYYHMAVIQGFRQAGGIVTHAFWEMAPGGRVHIYPPGLHAVGYVLALVGIEPAVLITFISWFCYPACLLGTWLWLRRVAGTRAALFGLVLLCSPTAFLFNQAAHTANAVMFAILPFALWAHGAEKYWTCGVLNLLAVATHPMGTALPAALGINTVLSRRRLLPGLLATVIPALIVSPWYLHMWLSRSILPSQYTSGWFSLGGHGICLGLLLLVAAALGLASLLVNAGSRLALVGPLLGFAVVFPLGIAGRFLTFNVHWPLACLGGVGLAELFKRLERCQWAQPAAQVGSLAVAYAALTIFPCLMILPEPPLGPPGFEPSPSNEQAQLTARNLKDHEEYRATRSGPAKRKKPKPGRKRPGPRRDFPRPKPSRDSFPPPRWQFIVSTAVLPTLLDPHAPIAPGFGRRPGLMHGPRGPNRVQRPPHPPAQPPGPGVMDLIHQPGAAEFLAAVRDNVPLDDVIFVRSPPAAGLITGVTGRWTSNGMLPGVEPAGEPARPEDCDFFALIGPPARGPAPPPGGLMPPYPNPKPPPDPFARLDALPFFAFGPNAVPPEFVKVFENEFGSLWHNPHAPTSNRNPARPALPWWLLIVLLATGLAFATLDCLPALRLGGHTVACITLLVAAGLPLPLACRSVERTMILGDGGHVVSCVAQDRGDRSMRTCAVLAVIAVDSLLHGGAMPYGADDGRKAAAVSPARLLQQVAGKSHPYLLFNDWKETPGYRHREVKPYGGRRQWLFYLRSSAERGRAMQAAFCYQVTKEKQYAEKAKAELMSLGAPNRTDHIRLAGQRLIDLALAYDWVQPTLSSDEDALIKAKLATFADILYQAYPTQTNAHDRIMGASGLGAIALALAGYRSETRSQPVDWLHDGTGSLFVKDRFEYPAAFRAEPEYAEYCPALRGVCNRGGFCRLGAYKNYWVTTWCRWLLIYAKGTGRNPLDDFPMARQIMDEPIWESMPNRMDSEQNTRKGKYWDYYRFLLPLLTPAERGGFLWYGTDPGIDPLRRRRTTPGLDGVPWGLCCFEKDLPTDAPFWTSFYSPSAEAIVFRRDWTVDADWLFFKCMNQPIPSHRDMAHHDNMSFELYSRGDYLLSDGGEIRKRMRGYGPEYACGHNTVLIDGVGPVKEDIQQEYYRFVNPARFTNAILEPWLELGEAEMTIAHVERNPVQVVIGPSGARGSTEATETDANARSLKQPVTWRRTILYPGKEYFLLIDAVQSRVKHDYDILFHFSSLNILKTTDRQHPGHVIGSLAIGDRRIDWAKDVQSDILTGANPRRTIGSYDGGSEVLWSTTNLQDEPVALRLISSSPADKISVGRIWGRVAETRPSYKGTFGGEVDHPFVSFHNTASQLATITAILTRYADEESERSARPVAVKGNGTALEVTRGGVADTIGTGQGELSYADVVTDAQVSLVRTTKNSLQTLLLIRGTNVNYKNKTWISTSKPIAHLALHYAGDSIVGHVNSPKPVRLAIRCDFTPETITYQPEPDDWIWVWTDELKERYIPRSLSFTPKADRIELRYPGGVGKIIIQ